MTLLQLEKGLIVTNIAVLVLLASWLAYQLHLVIRSQRKGC